MKLTFLGATGTVTGSKYLLTSETKNGGEKRIMIDCGLFQGLKQLRLRNWAALPINPKEVHAVVLANHRFQPALDSDKMCRVTRHNLAGL